MKNKLLLSSLAVLGMGVTVLPATCICMSSCTSQEIPTYQVVSFEDLLKFNSNPKPEVNSRVQINKSRSVDVDKLLRGWGGNEKCRDYVIFLGSINFDDTCKFFSGKNDIRSMEEWWGNNNIHGCNGFSDSDFGKKVKDLTTNDDLKSDKLGFWSYIKNNGKNFSFYNVVDTYSANSNGNGALFETRYGKIPVYCKCSHDPNRNSEDFIHPFQKWTPDYFTSTQEWNVNLKDQKISYGEYIRQDEQAIKYRKFVNTLSKIYPNHKITEKIGDLRAAPILKNQDSSQTFTSCSHFLYFHNGCLENIDLLENFDLKKTLQNGFDKWKTAQEEKENE